MRKILVIDDEPGILYVINDFLTLSGFDVITSSNPEKALEIINSDTGIELIISDIRMPQITGIMLLKQLMIIKRDIPVILLTGLIDTVKHKKDLQQINYPTHEILQKPIDLNELLEMVRKKLHEN